MAASDAINAAVEKMTRPPPGPVVLAKVGILDSFFKIGAAVVEVGSKMIPQLDPGLRAEFKRKEVAYLEAQCLVMAVMRRLLPDEVASSLDHVERSMRETVERESHNSALDDILEILEEAVRDIIAAIANLVLEIVGTVGTLLFKAADGAVALLSEAAQRTLRLASGIMERLLSLLVIERIHLDGTLRGGKGGLEFNALIEGIVMGEHFSFNVHIHIQDFKSFLKAIFA
jgi:hypothetical protein